MNAHLIRQTVTITLALYSVATWSAITSFTESYMGSGSGASCDSAYSIKGAVLDDGLQHLVFVYLVGTTENYANAQAMAAVNAMAEKGFVAATVQYRSATFGTCAELKQKAACIFNGATADSAVSKLCVRGDCGKGIVVGGFSQGAVLSVVAKDFEPRVQAAWGMGALNAYGTYNMASCMANGKHTLPASRLRIVNGEKDFFAGSTAAKVRASSTAVTGKKCSSTAYSCLNGNGSGWIMVKNAQVSDASADHCFQRKSKDCNGSQNILDPKWKSGSASFALPASLNWLKKFATP
jgi:hypothetical protein